jgi:hypothetical protein
MTQGIKRLARSLRTCFDAFGSQIRLEPLALSSGPSTGLFLNP